MDEAREVFLYDGGLGFARWAHEVAEQERAIRGWVAEVGRELRDVESQINFFRRLVESKFHREELKRGPVEVKCRSCRKT